MKSFKEIIKEAVSTTSKREIANKADRAFAGYIDDLKNALQDIKNNDYEWAKYRVESVADALKKLIPSLKEWGTLNKAGKLSESFPAAPSISGAFDDNDNYDKYVKANNDWKAKCQDKCNELSNKIQRMAGRFSFDILNSSKTSLSNKEKVDALNEFEKIYNDLDRLMDKTKIKKN